MQCFCLYPLNHHLREAQDTLLENAQVIFRPALHSSTAHIHKMWYSGPTQSLESEEPLIKQQTKPLPGHSPTSSAGQLFCHKPAAHSASRQTPFPTGADLVREGHRNLTRSYTHTYHTCKNKNELCTHAHIVEAFFPSLLGIVTTSQTWIS